MKVTPETISNAERDIYQPSLLHLRQIAKVLDKPISYLGCFEEMPEDTLGQQIRKARFYRGLQAVEAANELGVGVRTIINWETDRRKPSIKYMSAIYMFLEILN